MCSPDFKHIFLRNVEGVVVIGMVSRDIQGPELSHEFVTELKTVVEQGESKPILLDLRRAIHFSSMGYSTLFMLVKWCKQRQRPVTFCNMCEDVRRGAEIAGLLLVAEIHDTEESALKALADVSALRQPGDGE